MGKRGFGWGEKYYEKLAHGVMEAEKSQYLQSSSWRPRRAKGIVPVSLNA